MKGQLIAITLLLLIPGPAVSGQDVESILRPFADDIIRESVFEFVDPGTGKKFASTRNLPVMQHLKIEPMFLQWHYTSSLVYDGMLSLGKALNEEDYRNFGRNAFRFFFDAKDYHNRVKEAGYVIEGLERFGRFRGLWDNGSMGAALVRVCEQDPRKEYLAYLHQIADFFWKYDQDPDNLLRRKNVDQIYTQGVFMARMGKLTGERKYFDYAVEKFLLNDSVFDDPMTGLYSQMYYPELETHNNAKWLRGIGWALVAYVDMMATLPKDHPGYEKALRIYRTQVTNMSGYQMRSGLWRHLVNHPDSFEETSGSVYIVYAIARGINEGLLDPMYRDVAFSGWKGILSQRQANGDIGGSTPGVSHSTSPSFYLGYETVVNGDHLFGPLFLAGAEMIKLNNSYGSPDH